MTTSQNCSNVDICGLKNVHGRHEGESTLRISNTQTQAEDKFAILKEGKDHYLRDSISRPGFIKKL